MEALRIHIVRFVQHYDVLGVELEFCGLELPVWVRCHTRREDDVRVVPLSQGWVRSAGRHPWLIERPQEHARLYGNPSLGLGVWRGQIRFSAHSGEAEFGMLADTGWRSFEYRDMRVMHAREYQVLEDSWKRFERLLRRRD